MKPAVIAMKTGLLPLTTVSLKTTSVELLGSELEQRRQEAPALFNGLPCLLDLAGLKAEETSLAELLTILRQHGLSPVGVRNGDEHWQQQCQSLYLADFGQSTVRETSIEPVAATRSVKVYRGNVRSGQQLHWDGDLIIHGMVSAGAEVLATGDIHIMGALRGRALAGIKGNHQTIVSCLQFDAELVAIAGQYQLFDGEQTCKGQPVMVQLQNEQLTINGEA